MREILPGVFHWTAVHPKIKIEVSSYYIQEKAVLLDPLLPEEGLEWFRSRVEPRDILLTNRHHFRHCAEYQEAFGCTVWCNEEGMHEFTAGEVVQSFHAGDILAGGISSHVVGVLCPDETALLIPTEEQGALAIADGIVRMEDGPLMFVPDPLLGDEPEAIRRGLKAAYAQLLQLPFDNLLFAHGAPWIGGGKEALRGFVES
ncbi:MAG: hypothetical protein JRG89_05675 [Deltaproteobacteria bacterium]|nr:hypothetical protein [Deltaproteobacteria bacterium]